MSKNEKMRESERGRKTGRERGGSIKYVCVHTLSVKVSGSAGTPDSEVRCALTCQTKILHQNLINSGVAHQYWPKIIRVSPMTTSVTRSLCLTCVNEKSHRKDFIFDNLIFGMRKFS